jgi:hypothetical protein
MQQHFGCVYLHTSRETTQAVAERIAAKSSYAEYGEWWLMSPLSGRLDPDQYKNLLSITTSWEVRDAVLGPQSAVVMPLGRWSPTRVLVLLTRDKTLFKNAAAMLGHINSETKENIRTKVLSNY